jgi:hypothetical protein
MEASNIYTLRKINPNQWSNIPMYQGVCAHIGPCLDKVGLPITGLTEDSQFVNSKGQTEVLKGTRGQFEKLLGLEEDTLRQRSDFWTTFTVRIELDDLKLNADIPDHALKIAFLKAQKALVADGAKNIHSKAEYVLYTEEAEAESGNKQNKTKRTAYALFDELTPTDMREVLEMTGVRTSSLSTAAVESRLSDFMEEYHSKFVSLVKDPNRKNQSFVRRCLDKGVLEIDNGDVMFNEIVLGVDIPHATIALFSDEHARTRESIKLLMGVAPETPKTTPKSKE